MTRPTDVESAEVWRESTRVGTLERTSHGSLFEYDEEFFTRHSGQEGGIAVHLPYARRRTETHGTNLHPYFAGLLPEGLRLRALLQRVKTSEDDLFSLLIAAGADTVGDLSVVPVGGSLPEASSQEEPLRFEQVLFSELFARSLSRMGDEQEPVVPGVQEKVSASTIAFPLQPAGRHAFILKS